MSNRGRRDSRRTLFAPHAAEPLKLRRCPICQWAVEQDHAEAPAMHTTQPPILSPPPARLAPERNAQEAVAEVGFAFA
jgi:hypothetical protein